MAQRAPTAPIPESAILPLVCQHHWVIQPADGPSSDGSCQVCGEIREFKNYVESATWGDSRLAVKSSANNSGAVGETESSSDDVLELGDDEE